LDVDDAELAAEVVAALEQVVPVPKPKKKKTSAKPGRSK
jgi:hypothetical protein